MPIRREASYIGLVENADIRYDIIDREPLSPDFFEIVEFPEVLTAGKNVFKFRGDPDTLVDDSKIHIEILDYNGDPLYYEVLNYLEKDGVRVVSVWIYPDAPEGKCTFYLAGRVAFDPENNRRFPFSTDQNNDNYKDIPNLLWLRPSRVAPNKRNDSEIIFLQEPKVSINEVVKQFSEITDLPTFFKTVSGSGAGNEMGVSGVAPSGGYSTITTNIPAPTIQALTAAVVKTIWPNNTNYAVANKSALQAQYSAKTPTKTAGKSMLAVALPAALAKSPAVAGTTNNVTVSKVKSTTPAAVTVSKVKQSTVNVGNSGPGGTTLTALAPPVKTAQVAAAAPQPQVTSVQTVVFNAPDTTTATFSNFALTGSEHLGATVIFNKPMVQSPGNDMHLNSSGHIIHSTGTPVSTGGGLRKVDCTYVATIVEIENSTTARLHPSFDFLAGRASKPNDGQHLIDFEVSSVTMSYWVPQMTSETENSMSFAHIVINNMEPATGDVYKVKTQYKLMGAPGEFIDAGDIILEQKEILINTASNHPSLLMGVTDLPIGTITSQDHIDTYWLSESALGLAEFDNDFLGESMRLTSANTWTQPTDYMQVSLKNPYNPVLYANTEYALSFFSKFEQTSSMDVDLTSTLSGRIDVYVSGSKVHDTKERFGSMRGAPINVATEFDDGTLGAGIAPPFTDTEYGEYLGTVETSHGGSALFNQVTFVPYDTENYNLIFVVRKGRAYIKNIQLSANIETGFSPNYTEMNIRIPTDAMFSPLAFKFQYMDYRGAPSDTETFAQGAIFDGDNNYIEGTNNLITGSVNVGNAVGTGFQMAGVQSAFLRTVGYEGFTSASAGSGSGFMMYSGSVLTGTTNDYAAGGVGMDIVQDANSFFTFNTAGPRQGVQIKTPKFFFGGDSQFISGANGNIEISSSNFHLDNVGDVIMQGTITAEAGGVIGGANINSHSIAFPPYWEISSSGNPTNPVSFISSSQFKVSADGRMTASAGLIGGWTIAPTHLVDANNKLKLEPAGEYPISSSKFQITQDGDMSGSNALLTGGVIAGFTFSDQSLDGGALHINKGGFISSSGAGGWHISSSAYTPDPVGFISSSNFKVSADGRVTGSAILLGDQAGGNFLKFEGSTLTVQGSITADNISTPASAATPSSSISADGLATFKSASIGGFEVLENEIKSSNENLRLKSSGQITGSTALLTGGKIGNWLISGNDLIAENATGTDTILLKGDTTPEIKLSVDGNNFINIFYEASNDFGIIGKTSGNTLFQLGSTNTIAGFAFDDHSITTTGVEINDSSQQIFISSSAFKVDHAGNITASNVDLSGKISATSGDIAGFGINAGEISSSNNGLILRSTGVITGSNVQFTGGKIAGYVIDGTDLISTTNDGKTGQGIFLEGDSDPRIQVQQNATTDLIRLFYGSSVSWGLQGISGGNTLFQLGSTNTIAGFTFDNHSISTTGVEINDSTQTIFISSSNFKVSHAGDVTASNVDLSGNISATSGDIGGFAVTADAITGSAFFISGSASGNDGTDDTNLFISSSKFKVTADGDISGSSVLFDGNTNITGNTSIGGTLDVTGTGTIASWQIAANQLSSSDGRIILSPDVGIIVRKNPGLSADQVSINYLSDSFYGIKVNENGSSNYVFQAGNVNQIAGFTFTSQSLSTSGVEINNDQHPQFISSSAFKVTHTGQVTGSSILLGDKGGSNFLQFDDGTLTVQGDITANSISTPATAATPSSSITADGLATFKSASIAGFEVVDEEIKSSNNNLRLKATGKITGSEVLFTGGKVGGFSISSDHINDSANNFQLTASTGTVKAKLGELAGWTFDENKLQGGDMIIRSNGTIESAGFVSNLAGSGFRLTAASGGLLEVENARIRGTLSTAVFEKESVNAVGGQLFIANSTTLTESIFHKGAFHEANDTTMSVQNVTGFTPGEIVIAKKIHSTGFNTEYIKIHSASRVDSTSETNLGGFLFVTRSLNFGGGVTTHGPSGSLGDSPSVSQSYSGSQVLVSTGKVGSGYIRLNANPNDPTTPYMQIVERTGSALYDISLAAQVGDLSGITDTRFPNGVSGHGIYTRNGFFSGKIEVSSFPETPPSEDLLVRIPFDENTLSGSSGQLVVMDFANAGINPMGSNLHEGGNFKGIHLSGHAFSGNLLAAQIQSSSAVVGGAGIFSGYPLNGGKIEYTQTNFRDTLTITGWIKRRRENHYANPSVDGHGNYTRIENKTHVFSFKADQPHVHPMTGNGLPDGPGIPGFGAKAADTDYVAFDIGFPSENANPSATDADSDRGIFWGTGNSDTYGNPFCGTFLDTSSRVFVDEVLPYDEWKHFAIVNDLASLTCSLYVDGVVQGHARYRNTTTTNDMFIIGGNDLQDTENAVMELDEFRIYTGSLTDTQIEALYLEPSAGTGTTKIDGNQITTGKIKSNNFSGTEGSIFDLDNSTFKLGGANNPSLEWTGTELNVSGSSANITVDSFYLGKGTSQFISGADGNIEISSSLFHLDPATSTVAISGSVTATRGKIGGFTISNGNLVTSKFKLQSSTTEAPASFISSSAFKVSAGGRITGSNVLFKGGTIGGFTLSATEISSSGLLLKSSGQITGSNVLFDGGTIGGFAISADQLSTNGANDSGNITLGNSQLRLSATNSHYRLWAGAAAPTDAAFSVSKVGAITGSNVLFNGGRIGGFTMDGHSLRSTGVEINNSTQTQFISSSDFKVKHSGEMTGSDAFFDGNVLARAIRQEVLVLDSTNAINYITRTNQNVTIDGSGTQLQKTTIRLDGALNGGGHAQFSHVVIDLDMTSTTDGTANGTSCTHSGGGGTVSKPVGMLEAIIGPTVPGTNNRVPVTIEVKAGRTVNLFLDKTDTSGFNAIYQSSPANTLGVAVAAATFMSA
tara:strand:+ start:243 stop:8852 length:8610 start_codon:yes stop_codon:yes gene_type:complete